VLKLLNSFDVVAIKRIASGLGPAASRQRALAADPSILTALANDIGADVLFQRQIIAYGREGDVALALSTSGNSANIAAALEEARKRGLRTIAMVGYDGGRVASERLADHVVVSRSEHIPRIQEAQATAYHTFLALL
jgi:D-sedoheptulose 7-phosphate isomerase